MYFPNSAGVIGIGTLPRSASRAFSFESAKPALISLLSLSMISAGVFLGAPRPFQPIPSYPGTNSPMAGMSGNAQLRMRSRSQEHCNRRLSLRRLRTSLAGVGDFMAGNHPLCHSHFQKRACLGLRSKIPERSLRHFVIRLLLGFLRGRGRMVQARSLASISIARRCSYPASASSALSNPPRDSRHSARRWAFTLSVGMSARVFVNQLERTTV